MHPMLSKNWMEELCVAAECVLSYPMGKSAQGAVAILRPMAVADALEMILDDVVLQSDAGLFQEIEADSALCPETTRRAQDQSPGQGVVPGLTTENEDPKAMVRVRDLAMDISIPDNKQDEYLNEESIFEDLEQKNEDHHVYDTKEPPISYIEGVDSALGQVKEIEGQVHQKMSVPDNKQDEYLNEESIFEDLEQKNEDHHVYDTKEPPISYIEGVDSALGQVKEIEGH
ncbi:hypothetical protein KUCAC02_030628, partial [Chaenocephalus aceratus]